MLFSPKTKKRRRKVKKESIFGFLNLPIILLTIISMFFISSFIYEVGYNDKHDTRDINLKEILEASKNAYEKKTGHRIKLEVLNGCGQINVAVMYQDFLRDGGFDVMDAKNASSFNYKFSKILIHRGDIEMAYFLSNIMGIVDSLIIKDIDESLMIDISLIIGKDFKSLNSYDNAAIHYPIF